MSAADTRQSGVSAADLQALWWIFFKIVNQILNSNSISAENASCAGHDSSRLCFFFLDVFFFSILLCVFGYCDSLFLPCAMIGDAKELCRLVLT